MVSSSWESFFFSQLIHLVDGLGKLLELLDKQGGAFIRLAVIDGKEGLLRCLGVVTIRYTLLLRQFSQQAV